MNKYLLFLSLIISLLGVLFFYSLSNGFFFHKNIGDRKETNLNISTISVISPLDISSWKKVSLHQDISVKIPSTNWFETVDGVYNYNFVEATGLRDPNFPNNSFKCVFYKDLEMSNTYDIVNEKTLSYTPSIKYLNVKWNDKVAEGLTRSIGSESNLYLVGTGLNAIYVECNVFKGVMSEEDKNILENILLTINSD